MSSLTISALSWEKNTVTMMNSKYWKGMLANWVLHQRFLSHYPKGLCGTIVTPPLGFLSVLDQSAFLFLGHSWLTDSKQPGSRPKPLSPLLQRNKWVCVWAVCCMSPDSCKQITIVKPHAIPMRYKMRELCGLLVLLLQTKTYLLVNQRSLLFD